MNRKNGRFEMPLRKVTLKFEGDYEGAEMVCKMDISTGYFLEMQEMAGTDDVEKVRKAMTMFGDGVLMSTNINVDGKEITADAEGLLKLPLAFVTNVFKAWAEKINEDATPLVEAASE